jgi:hypothetical protein
LNIYIYHKYNFHFQYYINEESDKKPKLELAIQKYEEIQKEKLSIVEGIDRAHGRQTN